MGKNTAKIQKTNALRILDNQKVVYQTFEYDISDGMIDGLSVCSKLGLSAHESYKTLVACGKGSSIYVFVIPIESELDLKKAAAVCGEKKVELIAVKDILAITGYIRGGCSPIGMKKNYPTFVEQEVMKLDTLYISGGRKGLSVGISPEDLIKVVGAKIADLEK